MREASVELDEEVLEECMRITGVMERNAVIDLALRELARRGISQRLLALKGAVAWEGDLDSWRQGRVGMGTIPATA